MSYYVIDAKSDLGIRLTTLYARARECEQIARNFSKEFDGTGNFIGEKYQKESFGPLKFTTGGVSAIEFATHPGKGWKQYSYRNHKNLYQPRKNNIELVKRFEALPTINHDEFSEAIGWKPQTVGNRVLFHLGMKTHQDEKGNCTFYGFTVPEGFKYEEVDDVHEIVGSKFKELFT